MSHRIQRRAWEARQGADGWYVARGTDEAEPTDRGLTRDDATTRAATLNLADEKADRRRIEGRGPVTGPGGDRG